MNRHVAIERKYVDGPNGQIHFIKAYPNGLSIQTKPPLVCFRQSPVSGAQYAFFQQEMAFDQIVICPDTPGFGGLDPPQSVPRIEDYTSALAVALEALGYGDGSRVDVLGFHTGTQICVEMAASRPDLVRRVVVSSLALFTEVELTRNRVGFGGPRPMFEDLGYLGRYYNQQVTEGLEGISMERRLELFAERLRSGILSWYGPEAVFAYDTESRLRAVSQSTLLLVLRDTLSENTRRAESLVQRAKVVERMAIHGPAGWDSHTKEIAAEVRRFLDADT